MVRHILPQDIIRRQSDQQPDANDPIKYFFVLKDILVKISTPDYVPDHEHTQYFGDTADKKQICIPVKETRHIPF